MNELELFEEYLKALSIERKAYLEKGQRLLNKYCQIVQPKVNEFCREYGLNFLSTGDNYKIRHPLEKDWELPSCNLIEYLDPNLWYLLEKDTEEFGRLGNNLVNYKVNPMEYRWVFITYLEEYTGFTDEPIISDLTVCDKPKSEGGYKCGGAISERLAKEIAESEKFDYYQLETILYNLPNPFNNK